RRRAGQLPRLRDRPGPDVAPRPEQARGRRRQVGESTLSVSNPLLIRARHYATREPVEVLCAGGHIRAVSPAPPGQEAGAADVRVHEGGWVAPALFDLQINGCD